jgi:hypothetical protein
MSKMFSRLMTAGALVWSIGCGGGGDAQGSGGNAPDGGGGATGAAGSAAAGGDTAGGAGGGAGALGTGGGAGSATTTDGGAAGAGGGSGVGGDPGAAGASGAAGATATGGGGGSGAGGGPGTCGEVWAGDIQIGTPLDDEITAVTAAAGGGFYVTGYENGDDESTDVIPAGNARAVVARYDGSGQAIWAETLDTSGADTAEDVRVDPATGNLIVLGRTSGAFSGFQNAGQFDTYVAVLNGSGNLLSAIQFGDERPQHPTRLGLGPNNKIIVAGYDDLFIDVNFLAAYEHGFVAQLSTGAAPSFALSQDFWRRSAYFDSPAPPRSNEDFTTGVAIAAGGDGSFYLSSTVNGAADQRGMFVTKVDGAGQTVWSSRLSGEPGDFAAAIGFAPNGNLIVAGTATPEVAGSEIGQQDAFAARVDEVTGTLVWATAAGSADGDFTTAMAFDAASNIYITGQTLGTVAGGAANQGGIDVFVAKIGPSGGVQSYFQRGSAGDDLPASIAIDACGRVFVGGYTTGALVAGQPSAGGRDMFVVKAELR